MIHELLRVIVIENKILSYEQFMENTQNFEIITIINMLKYANRPAWEQTRYIMYSSLLPYFKKGANKDIEDFFPLAFDENKAEHKNLDNNDIVSYQQIMEATEKIIAAKKQKIDHKDKQDGK